MEYMRGIEEPQQLLDNKKNVVCVCLLFNIIGYTPMAYYLNTASLKNNGF